VPVAWRLKSVLAQAVKLVGTVVQDLEELGQGLGFWLLEVTTANDKQSLGGRLAVLEIMLEVCLHIHGALVDDTFGNVEFKNDFAVTLTNVERGHFYPVDLGHKLYFDSRRHLARVNIEGFVRFHGSL
jgi:hypothetical protein